MNEIKSLLHYPIQLLSKSAHYKQEGHGTITDHNNQTWFRKRITKWFYFDPSEKKATNRKTYSFHAQFEEALLELWGNSFLDFYLDAQPHIQIEITSEDFVTINDEINSEKKEPRVYVFSTAIPGFQSLEQQEVLGRIKQDKTKNLPGSLLICLLGLTNDRKLDNIGVNENGEIVHIDTQFWFKLFYKKTYDTLRLSCKFHADDLTPITIIRPKHYHPHIYLTLPASDESEEERQSHQNEINALFQTIAKTEQAREDYYFRCLQIIAYPMEWVLSSIQASVQDCLLINENIPKDALLRSRIAEWIENHFSVLKKNYLSHSKKQLNLKEMLVNELFKNEAFRDFLLKSDIHTIITELVNHLEKVRIKHPNWMINLPNYELEAILRGKLLAAREIARNYDSKRFESSTRESPGFTLETTYTPRDKDGRKYNSHIPVCLESVSAVKSNPDAVLLKQTQLEIQIQKILTRFKRTKKTHQQAELWADQYSILRQQLPYTSQAKLQSFAYIHINLIIHEHIQRLLYSWDGVPKAKLCQSVYENAINKIDQHPEWNQEDKTMYLALAMLDAFKQGRVRGYHFKNTRSYTELYKCITGYLEIGQNNNSQNYYHMLDALTLHHAQEPKQSHKRKANEDSTTLSENIFDTFSSFFNKNDEISNKNKNPQWARLFSIVPKDKQFTYSYQCLRELVLSLAETNSCNISSVLALIAQQLCRVKDCSEMHKLVTLISSTLIVDDQPAADLHEKTAAMQLLQTAFQLENSFWQQHWLNVRNPSESSTGKIVEACWKAFSKIIHNEAVNQTEKELIEIINPALASTLPSC